MIGPKLAFFKMQGKGKGMHASVFEQADFGKAPESFDSVDVGFVIGKLILSVIDSEMLSVDNVNQAVVAASAIGVDNAVKADLAPNTLLQRGLRAIGNDFGVHAAIAFEDAEDDGFSVSASSSFSF
jgi:hypothetical protein